MAVLTDEQKQYVKNHPEESSVTIAHKLGIGRQQAYYWLHRFHGAEITFAKKEGLNDREKVVLELYPTHSASEISRVLGLTKAAINNMAHRLGVKHTDETNERIMRECIFKAARPDVVRRRTEKLKRVIAMEKLRVINGEKQLTKRKIIGMSNRARCARHNIIRKYNYFYDKEIGEPYTLFYDSDTKRLPKEREQYYNKKYRLVFKEAG